MKYKFKILVIGDVGAGKTSIIRRYAHDYFTQYYQATVGVDFCIKVVNWDENTMLDLQIWDLAGQEHVDAVTRSWFRNADGALIVHDISRADSVERVIKWKETLDGRVLLPNGEPIPCVLLANKCDLNGSDKVLCYRICDCLSTSAKENINIQEAFKRLIEKMMLNKTIGNESQQDSQIISFEDRSRDVHRKRKLCQC